MTAPARAPRRPRRPGLPGPGPRAAPPAGPRSAAGRARARGSARRRGARAALAGAVVAALLAGCGEARGPRAVEGLAPAPRASLLDPAALSAWRVSAWPDTDLPLDVAAGPGSFPAGRVVRLRGDDWSETTLLPALFRDSLALGPGARVWRAAPRLGALPDGVEPRLEHEGRALEPVRLPGGARLWRDPDSDALFWWDAVHGSLVAFAPWSPGELLVDASGARPTGAGVPDDDDDGSGVDPSASGAARRPSVADLRRALEHARTRREGLLTAVPAELAVDLAALPSTRLSVVTAVAPRSAVRDDAGRVLQAVEQAVPVRFALEHQRDDGSRRRLWEHVQTAADGFSEHLVDLAGFADRGLRLRLVTELAGDPAGRMPWAFWSGLRFAGAAPDDALPPPPSVVLVQVDGLRADRLAAQGAARATTPALDAWAARAAVLHTDALSPADWTLPASASLLTGAAPHQHGVLRFPQGLDDALPTLAERLRAAGYATFALTEGGYVSSTFGFDRGFDVFVQQPFQHADWTPALEWLDARAGARPVFLYLHTYLVHAPWIADTRFADPERPYDGPFAGRDITHDWILRPFEHGQLELTPADRGYVRDLYDAAVARFDAHFANFLAELDTRLPPGERLLVLTADHGMELFDHGHVEYGRSLHRGVLEVPLVVEHPAGGPTGRAEQPASLLDVLPTVLATAGLPLPEQLPGRPLHELQERRRLRVSQHGADDWAVHFDGWKLLAGTGPDAPPPVLHDLASDPDERVDLAAANPEWTRRLRAMLDEYRAEHPPLSGAPAERAVDPRVLEELRGLGDLRER